MSPILHDYKPSSTAAPRRKLKPGLWFAVGLGLPLLGIVLVSTLRTTTTRQPTAVATPATIEAAPVAAATDSNESETVAHESIELEIPVAAAVAEPAASQPAGNESEPVVTDLQGPAFHPPLLLPPEHDELTMTVRRGDTLDRLFRNHDLDLGELAAIIRLPEAAPHLKKLIPGDEIRIAHNEGSLVSLYRELDLTSALEVNRGSQGFAARIVERPIETRQKMAFGTINSSLFESAAAAGLSDRMIMNLAGIFAWDVDFVLDIRNGDRYYIVYEEIFQDGRYVADGEIVAAEFDNNGQLFQAIRFIDDDGRSDYFTPDGRSVRKAFVRAPVDFTRISSSFNPRRRHPILNTIRAHRGVDYAAPKGTPIKAAGDGKVIFRGVKGGYGNAVIVQHGGNITTLYAHMSGFDKSARVGRRVIQGQTIGYVGKTGLATAPHLHYEYRLNGVHRNPRTVNLPQADPIDERYRDKFLAAASPLLDELQRYKQSQVALLTHE